MAFPPLKIDKMPPKLDCHQPTILLENSKGCPVPALWSRVSSSNRFVIDPPPQTQSRKEWGPQPGFKIIALLRLHLKSLSLIGGDNCILGEKQKNNKKRFHFYYLLIIVSLFPVLHKSKEFCLRCHYKLCFQYVWLSLTSTLSNLTGGTKLSKVWLMGKCVNPSEVSEPC